MGHRSVPASQLARLALAFAFLLCTIVDDAAASIKVINIRTSFGGADAVLLVEIDEQQRLAENGTECGIRYAGRIRGRFKGAARIGDDNFTFGRYDGLAVGKTYLLFLNYITDPNLEYESIKRENHFDEISDPVEKDRIFRLVECRGIVPGFVFDSSTAWEVGRESVTINGVRPEELIYQEIRHFSSGPLEWRVPKGDFFSYLRALGSSPN